jgi:hypothetical protein
MELFVSEITFVSLLVALIVAFPVAESVIVLESDTIATITTMDPSEDEFVSLTLVENVIVPIAVSVTVDDSF